MGQGHLYIIILKAMTRNHRIALLKVTSDSPQCPEQSCRCCLRMPAISNTVLTTIFQRQVVIFMQSHNGRVVYLIVVHYLDLIKTGLSFRAPYHSIVLSHSPNLFLYIHSVRFSLSSSDPTNSASERTVNRATAVTILLEPILLQKVNYLAAREQSPTSHQIL